MIRHAKCLTLLIFTALMMGGSIVSAYAQNADIEYYRNEAEDARAFADKRRKHVEQWQERAAQARERAESSTREIDRESYLDDARLYEQRAEAAAIEADKAEAQAVKAEAELVQALKKFEKGPEEQTASPSPPETDEETVPILALEDIIGFWEIEETGSTFVIVQEEPGSEIQGYKLEAHTQDRVWKGTHTPFEDDDIRRMQDAPVVLKYTPKAEEMNPEIPEWARLKVEGQLEWVIELEAADDSLEPALKGAFFPGEVQWRGDESGGIAKIKGKGKGRDLKLNHTIIAAVNDASRAQLKIRLANVKHDPDVDPLQAMMKGQRFFIHVTLPADQAREQGDTLEVSIKGLESGDEDVLRLKGSKAEKDGDTPISYSNEKAVYIHDCDVFADTKRNPGIMSIPWIIDLVYNTEGDCLDIGTENKDLVEFRFDESYHQVAMYDSWVQRAVERHQQGFERLEILLKSTLEQKPEHKEKVQTRLAMIENYRALVASSKLTDVHVFYIGEEYLGSLIGTGLVYLETEDLQRKYDNRGLVKKRKTDQNFYSPIVQAYLEGLSGKDLTLDSHDEADQQQIAWTSEAERYFILKAIEETSAEYASDAVKANAKELTLGLYDGWATSLGPNSFIILMTGRDHMGRKLPTWMRVHAGIAVGTAAVAGVVYNASWAQRFLANAPARQTLGRASQQSSLGVSKNYGQVSRLDKLSDVVDVPDSLSPVQKQQAKRELFDSVEGDGGPDCAPVPNAKPKAKKPADKNRPITQQEIDDFVNLNADELVENYHFQRYIENLYPKGTTLVKEFGKKISNVQTGPSCNIMSIADDLRQWLGRNFTQQELQRIADNILWEDVKSGRRTLNEILRGPGRKHGYDQKLASDVLRKFGARVAERPPKFNRFTRLRDLWTYRNQGWNMKMIVKFGAKAGQHAYHAIRVLDFDIDKASKKFKRVKIFDSNTGQTLWVPARGFKNMIANDVPYSNLTLYRWD